MSYRDCIRKVEPYIPGAQPKEEGMIKLNTNECPYPPAPGIQKLLSAYCCDDMRLYPNPNVKPLVGDLAKYYGLKEEQVFVGVGSDDVLSMAFLACFHSDRPILFPDITYGFYDVWANVYRIPFETCPLSDTFRIQIEDFKKPNGGIVLANPNAPTGEAVSLEVIEEILMANPDVVVIIDEAYVDFGAESAVCLIPKYENLLVVQTFSKSRALAGGRIGYAMGNKELISYINQVKFSVNSYTINSPTLAFASEAIRDDAYFKEIITKICKTRERVQEELRSMGFVSTNSCGNFLFVTHPDIDAKMIYEELTKQKIYVRYFNKKRIDNHLRITIGTDEQMNALIGALTVILNKKREA